jgi:hypothetical protein
VGRPRFYGGSFLKVRIAKIRCPGTFSQSIVRDIPKNTLYVCFVAILRARSVAEENLETSLRFYSAMVIGTHVFPVGSARRQADSVPDKGA